MILKCSECGCSHDDCKARVSPLECTGCFLDECCCGLTVDFNNQVFLKLEEKSLKN